MKYILTVLLSTATLLSTAQSSISDLSDEFDDTASLSRWKLAHETEGFPNKIKKLAIDKAGNSLLLLEPGASGWYADYQAPFIFKMVNGNFDVRMKIKISSTGTALPLADWSLAGLMVRQPKRTTKETWKPKEENWLFITTGIAHQPGLPVIEVKTTNNSLSNLKLRPVLNGWLELRIVRLDASFILMARNEGQSWQVLERFYRPLLPPNLQVGISAYSGWETMPPQLKQDPKLFNETVPDTRADLLVEVDYIRFKKPGTDMSGIQSMFNKEYGQTLYYSLNNLLTDYSISNEQLLKILGE